MTELEEQHAADFSSEHRSDLEAQIEEQEIEDRLVEKVCGMRGHDLLNIPGVKDALMAQFRDEIIDEIIIEMEE